MLLEGRPLRAYGSYERGRLLAYLPQNGPYPEGLLVEEVVRLGRLPHLGLWGREGREDREAVDWALEVTGASAFRGRLLGTLSGGERQRVLLARALAGRPRYLLLDEPTTFLDLAHQGVVVGLLRRLAGMGLGVLSVLHDPNQAALAHRVAVLEGEGWWRRGGLKRSCRNPSSPGSTGRGFGSSAWGEAPCLPGPVRPGSS